MATYAIGDVQGCLPELQRLLEKLRFDPAADRLWFCGDLVNRGGQSLDTLRLIHSLREQVVLTLGNHDLSLLAIAQRRPEAQSKVNPELREVLFADDAPVLFEWMRSQKLMHHDEALGWTMVHAGLAPIWTLRQALRSAQEVERELSSPRHGRILKNLFGNRPAAWTSRLQGIERMRASINTFTRMRYCDIQGRIDFESKDIPGTQKPGMYPWFEVPGMKRREGRIVCGHWSALGRFAGLGIYAIDTGCVWGGKLTALRLDSEEPQYITVDAEPHRKRMPGED
ncbi:symmetrical bis(5'-nucleosyl)-tetraphosphatase [Dyella sp. LX-66]|uniref:symmetrical bis(5'-nucleosyl)-tetraphosphatase n=1 Tax=unclassified Dyella TaxID=2634549 RepID=UPI001BE02B28|nr:MULTISPECIES: symmetrical bis(5'-nucleosyl)-tetraphosphatase [unclassified Dyella]MBT2115621.1 symmetrical bis(5'-nucleosyl)-tetraphosphatase [Dyella sp. LX-1]MBT2139436.1 symmetrical bis(5'-nucleosyl)-tetraphosphatase [Dyella sp. LX-66]